MSESHLVPEQTDYQRKSYAGPKYKFSRIVPLSGSQTVNIPIASTAEVLMEVPTNVHNWAESFLFGNVAYPAQAAGERNWMHVDGMPLISEVDLYTRSGIYLCQLPNFQNYMKVIRKLHTHIDEYDSNDQSSFLFPGNSLNTAVPIITPSNGNGTVPNRENAYVMGGGAAATATALTMNLPMKAIKKTIFALDKDIVFPDIIVLRILFGPSNRAMYSNTSANDPADASTIAMTLGTITISNLTLYLATEKNEDIAQSVRALVNRPEGLNLLVDYPYSYKQALTGTSQNLSYRFNRGHGKNLMEVVSAPFHATEAVNTSFDNSNVLNVAAAFPAQTAVGAKVVSYYSQLDNVRLQDITLVCGFANADDYRENRKYLKDTPYFNNSVFNNNWLHCDKFYENSPGQDVADENLDKGMSLIVERKYDLLATVSAVASTPPIGGTAAYTPSTNGINWYTFAILQKDLHIGANMIQYQ